jgi:carboxyl-terminal processing protease
MIRIKRAPKPDFEFTCFINDDSGGNGDGRVQPGERIQMTVRVRNRGLGSSKETTTYLKNLAGDGIFLEKGRKTDLRPIEAGDARDVDFVFEVRPTMSATRLPFQISIRDSKNAVYLYQRISIPLHATTSLSGSKVDGTAYVNSDATLFGGASSRFPKVARLRKGTRMQRVAKAGSWTKVKVQDGIGGWLRTRDTQEESVPGSKGRAEAVSAFRPPQIEITAPTPQTRVTDQGKIRLTGIVRFFPSQKPAKRAVTIFVRGQKIWFTLKNAGDDSPLDIPFDIDIACEPGINKIQIGAMEKDRVDVFRSIFIYREETK